MTTDMKAAIERVRGSVSGVYPCSASPVDTATVLALAEIGRLAVEWRAASSDTVRQAQIDLMAAADACLAGRGT